MVSCRSPNPKSFARQWVLDSGASVNMMRTSDLSKKELEHVGPLKNPCRLGIANGIIYSDVGITVHIAELGITDEVHICDSAPKGIGPRLRLLLVQKGMSLGRTESKEICMSCGGRCSDDAQHSIDREAHERFRLFVCSRTS